MDVRSYSYLNFLMPVGQEAVLAPAGLRVVLVKSKVPVPVGIEGNEDGCLLGCSTVWSGRSLATFQGD
jgi:hypothetical protein